MQSPIWVRAKKNANRQCEEVKIFNPEGWVQPFSFRESVGRLMMISWKSFSTCLHTKTGLSEPGFRDFKGCKGGFQILISHDDQSILTSFKIPQSGFRQSCLKIRIDPVSKLRGGSIQQYYLYDCRKPTVQLFSQTTFLPILKYGNFFSS